MKARTKTLAALTAVVGLVAAVTLTSVAAAGSDAVKQRVMITTQAAQTTEVSPFVLTPLQAGAIKPDSGKMIAASSPERIVMREGQRVSIYDGGSATLKGKLGSLVIRYHSEWVDAGNGYHVATDTWKVVRGTGQYAGVTGGGRGGSAWLEPQRPLEFAGRRLPHPAVARCTRWAARARAPPRVQRGNGARIERSGGMNASTKCRRGTASLVVVAAVAVVTAAGALAQGFGPWSAPASAESVSGTSSELNTSFQDGCPILSPDGLSLYMASNRPGGMGGLDIWVATRTSTTSPFAAPVNLGAPVNSTADDFCPSPMAGGWFFFVSTRAPGCGDADIYVTRPAGGGWWQPLHLGCKVNSPGQEASPYLLTLTSGKVLLYFSSNRTGGFAPDTGAPDHDVYVSPLTLFGFAPPQLVPGINTPQTTSGQIFGRTGWRSCSTPIGPEGKAARTSTPRRERASRTTGRVRSTWVLPSTAQRARAGRHCPGTARPSTSGAPGPGSREPQTSSSRPARRRRDVELSHDDFLREHSAQIGKKIAHQVLPHHFQRSNDQMGSRGRPALAGLPLRLGGL